MAALPPLAAMERRDGRGASRSGPRATLHDGRGGPRVNICAPEHAQQALRFAAAAAALPARECANPACSTDREVRKVARSARACSAAQMPGPQQPASLDPEMLRFAARGAIACLGVT